MEDREKWTDEQWDEAQKKFDKEHNPPKAKEIEVLNLVLKKEYAQEIIDGKKTVEFRPFTDFYESRLVDKDVKNWIIEHEEISQEDINDFVDMFRPVKKIHFYSYSNTWFLDVECVYNYIATATVENGERLKEEFNSDELLELAKSIDGEERPIFFYFALGKILDKKL